MRTKTQEEEKSHRVSNLRDVSADETAAHRNCKLTNFILRRFSQRQTQPMEIFHRLCKT